MVEGLNPPIVVMYVGIALDTSNWTKVSPSSPQNTTQVRVEGVIPVTGVPDRRKGDQAGFWWEWYKGVSITALNPAAETRHYIWSGAIPLP